jgi:hypothetical protein
MCKYVLLVQKNWEPGKLVQKIGKLKLGTWSPKKKWEHVLLV